MQHSSVVTYLVKCKQQKSHVHTLNYRSQTCHSSSDAHAHKTVLANWGVQQSHVAIFFVQVVGYFVTSSVMTNILSNKTDSGVLFHFLIHCFSQSFPHQFFLLFLSIYSHRHSSHSNIT
eukprot:EC095352.1.p3 GENE.EC095352.1~~EC095352.1.p3  ORF type:complete len:119 (-),score=6.95 EC095352.1:81-437(-)